MYKKKQTNKTQYMNSMNGYISLIIYIVQNVSTIYINKCTLLNETLRRDGLTRRLNDSWRGARNR